ncbi:MAG: flagellar filament capping protein FliD [Nitrosomonadales bacterium]|nr:flagellar filament capping protein FliD [Nitrosomonadales bacterium]
MTLERRPITLLNTKEASYQAQISAYGLLKGAVGSFQSALLGLSSAGSFQSLSATPADNSIVTASASSAAVAGSYTLEVSQLAKSQNLVATGQASTTASIGNGTVTIDFGTISIGSGSFDAVTGKYTGASFTSNGNGAKTLTIDASNNSLSGIRDAINAANIGVTATIINDGSTTPYRLSLSSNNMGQSNSLKISVAGDAALANLLGQDPAGVQNMSEVATAQNASLKVNGVAISKTSNTVTDVIPGVTLNLLKQTTSATSLTVARDSASVQSSVGNFVQAYNDLNSTLKNLSGYDAATQKGGILQGDSTVLQLQSQIRSILTRSITNTSGSLTTLSQIGVSFQRDGSLALDSTKLSSAIASNFSDIAALFAETGRTTDSLVSFTSNTGSTKVGTYAVNITRLATQGSLTGSAAPVSTTIVAGVNDALDISLNGKAASIVLAAGSYTAAALAAELQSKINGVSDFASNALAVTVTQSGGAFTLTSTTYGASSAVAATGGNGLANLLGTPTQVFGVDVEGTLGGQAATASGQSLIGTGDAEGLKILVSGGALGDRGNVSYSQGYAYNLNVLATNLLSSDGALNSRTTGITSTIDEIGKQRTALERRMVAIEARYRAQFTQLDTLLSSMNQTSTYLTQQLNALQSLN